MSRPVRSLTQAKGFDTGAHSLACFGGAGAQHACALAQALGMPAVRIHRSPSTASPPASRLPPHPRNELGAATRASSRLTASPSQTSFTRLRSHPPSPWHLVPPLGTPLQENYD